MAYTRTQWNKGDVIDAAKLGNIENGIFAALNTLENLTDVTYDSEKVEKENLVPEHLLVNELIVGNSSTLSKNNTTLDGDLTVNRVTKTDGSYTTVTIDADTTLKQKVNILDSLTVGSQQVSKNTTLYGDLTTYGALTINTEPTENSHAATKKYVDNAINGLDVSTISNTQWKTLSTLSEADGKISAEFQDIEIAENQVTNLTTHLDEKAALGGATFTGMVTLAGNPEEALHAATKQYIDNITTLQNLSISMDQVQSLRTYLSTRALKNNPEFSGTLLAKGESNNFSLITNNEDPNNVIKYYSATISNEGILARTSIAIQNQDDSNLTMSLSYNSISIIQQETAKNLISYIHDIDSITIGDSSSQTFILGSPLIMPENIITSIKTTSNLDGKQGYTYDYNLTVRSNIGELILKCSGANNQSTPVALSRTPVLLDYQPWGFENGEALALGGPSSAVSDSNCVTETFIRAKDSIILAPQNGQVSINSNLSLADDKNLVMHNGATEVSLSAAQLADLLALLDQQGGE